MVSSNFYLLLSSFFLAYSQPSQIGSLLYFHTWYGGPSANLGCRSERCSMRLAGNAGRKYRQKFAICAPSYNFVGLRKRHCIDHLKKILKQQYISSTCLHNIVNFGLLTAEICWRVWGTPANFNGFRVLAALLHLYFTINGSTTDSQRQRWSFMVCFITASTTFCSRAHCSSVSRYFSSFVSY